ncbi:protein fantom [Amia ocellicauda]|uniref:protein fantom n=1 Tax=Amia ocellicauda TaxID=2972642 RepID=UPI0034648B32
MSLAVDETAGDLPVRDVGLKCGLISAVQDAVRERQWRKPQILKIKDRQRVSRVSREQLEDQCLRLQEEKQLLGQHCRALERRTHRLSTKLQRLTASRGGSGGGVGAAGGREAELQLTVQELRSRVASLENQREALRSRLSLATKHCLSLGVRGPGGTSGHVRQHPKSARGVRGQDSDLAVRRSAHTAPPRFELTSLQETRGEMERLAGVQESQRSRVLELEEAAELLRESLRSKEQEIQHKLRELHKQQAEEHRTVIRESVDVIRVQRQLSEKSAALLALQEKFKALQQAYESQMEESERSLRESHSALLERVEELTEELKQERQRALALESELNTATLSQCGLEEMQERVTALEGERDLLKESYDSLLESSLGVQSQQGGGVREQKEDGREEEWRRGEVCRLEARLQEEREDRERMEQQRDRERGQGSVTFESLREKNAALEQEILQKREEVTSLQEKLDSITKEFNMSVEELSETLLQIKLFRLQREGEEQLDFLERQAPRHAGTLGEHGRSHWEAEAGHAEALLELNKTRELLSLQHRLNTHCQAELQTLMERAQKEKEESEKRLKEKDRLLERRAERINTLQTQLREMAYSHRSSRRAVPPVLGPAGGGVDGAITLDTGEEEAMQWLLRGGQDSLLELHLGGATFTPASLRLMMSEVGGQGSEVVTFCTYSFLDFETHATPLVRGGCPVYGYTSRYPVAPRDLRLGEDEGAGVRVELHQSLGGVRFLTRGAGLIPLREAQQREGERVSGTASITGSDREILGVLDYWVRLWPPLEPTDEPTDGLMDRHTGPGYLPSYTLGWGDPTHQGLFDFSGGGVANELEVLLQSCCDLSACPGRPGLLPCAYAAYRLYDLPPRATPAAPPSANPALRDRARYPLAVTPDLLAYLRGACLWVYVFDASASQLPPPAYLGKTPVPLRPLAMGRPVTGEFVLRDAVGQPRGTVRLALHWRFPFQPQGAPPSTRQERRERETERERAGAGQRPVAKPRSKLSSVIPAQTHTQPQPQPPPFRHKRLRRATPSRSHDTVTQPYPPDTVHAGRGDAVTTEVVEEVATEEEEAPQEEEAEVEAEAEHAGSNEEAESERGESAQLDDDVIGESGESRASTDSDVIIVPHLSRPAEKVDKLRVEILSLSFDPTSRIALDQSVQRIYVEYRLLGIPMETTETPMSLRKPTAGEEIHYNFTRVISVDRAQDVALRQYLYTMLEGADPNQGRLKFTVVSEPMDEQEEECVDVGHAHLDLQEVLLTGSDIVERQIDIVSVEEEGEVVGKLKVSLEAAQTLTGIYWEYRSRREEGGEGEEREREGEEEEGEEEEEAKQASHQEDDDDF